MMMNSHIDAKEPSEMAADVEKTTSDQERLAACGFTSEEIFSLLWLQQRYQRGGQ
jgi:hypothetical protein